MRHVLYVCLITLSALYSTLLVVMITKENYNQYLSEVATEYTPIHVNRVYSGRVLIEFCERVLAGRISAQSNVLVVSPEVIQNGVYTEETTSRFVHISHNGPAKTVLSIALQENHVVHALPPSADLNSWWNKKASSPATKPSWILLAYFIAQRNSYSLNCNDDSIDRLLHPDRVGELLKESTITYIVFHVQAQWDNKSGVKMHGLTAIQTLINTKYKVQVLASSHYCTTEILSAENNKYGPNTLLKSSRELEEMFISCYDRHYNPKDKSGLFVEALLFATQGLDLAIPSRRSYLSLTRKTCPWQNNERCDLSVEKLDDFLPTCPSNHSRVNIVFNDKDSAANSLIIYLDEEEVLTITDTNSASMITNRLNTERSTDINIKDIWLGHEDINRSEAACVAIELINKKKGIFHHKNARQLPLVSCVTRIIPALSQAFTRNNETVQFLHNKLPKKSFSKTKAKPNVLMILLDPMSRSQFRKSLPRTAKLLTELGFTRFSHYSAVGDNSGPNQAALFTGKILKNGRENIRSSIATNDGRKIFWLWDELQSYGYVTLKAENGCISNSNMLQSIKPRTTHGQQLLNMYCFDFDRPNCLGKNLTAEYLTNHATQFIDAYRSDEHRPNHPPWAAFISFVDGHEDTLTLASLLDKILLKFIHDTSKVASNTAIVVLSDHGLHYGPYFRSIPGERERAEPILYLRLPESPSRKQIDVLNSNSKMFVTPFDVHETILDISLDPQASSRQRATERSKIIGSSLLHPLSTDRTTCRNTPGIPTRLCYSKAVTRQQPMGTLWENATSSCQLMPHPPSAITFFSDIPRGNRPIWPNCKLLPFKGRKYKNCYCATNERDWHDCEKNFTTGMNSRENFHIISCDGEQEGEQDGEQENDITVHINISRREEVADRHYSLKKSSNSQINLNETFLNTRSNAPNILFIEVDSVSQMSAERLFPRTQQVLKSLKINVDAKGKLYCPKGLCSAMFEKSSIVGRNSIPNQLAALSGCINQNFYNDENLHLYTKGRQGMFDTWCPTKNKTSENPWIFSIARDLGYVTFFGEEFCYNSSPYVIQNNIFPLDADITLHEIFCLLASDTIRRKKFDKKKDLWSVEHDWSSNPKPCLNGGNSRQQLAFDLIFQLWKRYEDIPKLVFLNALAAHDYSLDVAFQIIGAEAYDELLSSFLEKMINQADADNTIIIIRSDHGLQGGPLKVDYSTQIEHMNPWNNIIVPATYPTLSIAALEANQRRLVTGFDLYHMIRNLITLKQPRTPDGIPKWSFDLIATEIPVGRSCSDARIPLSLCPCMNERTDMGFNFDIGLGEKADEES